METDTCKNYSELSPSSCMSLIIRDVMNDGGSSGWHGQPRDLFCLKRMLYPLHVRCFNQEKNLYRFEK